MQGEDATDQSQKSEAADTARRVRAILAGSSGNFVEWFDFYVYSAFSLYFAKSFFPEGDQTAQLLGTAGIFAAGFLMRPIGAWFFGRLADQRGRRLALTASILLMCFGSLLVAVTPVYASIGIGAPIFAWFRPPPETLHGDARWARRVETRKAGLFGDQGIVIGEWGGRLLRHGGTPMVSPHVFLAAPTGSGKTQGVMLPNASTWTGSLVALDLKGDRKSTRLNSSHLRLSRMPSSA